jgi:hypothetical protein
MEINNETATTTRLRLRLKGIIFRNITICT